MMTAALLALVLSQTEGTVQQEDKGAQEAPAPEVAASLPTLTPTPNTPLPVMPLEGFIECAQLAPSPQVPSGVYRVKCDETTLRCLASPVHELEADGTESDRPLTRLLPCNNHLREVLKHELSAYTFVPAIADALPGWYRDERGRVMQFNFDLHRRAWLGGGWAPLWRDGEQSLSRGRADFGFTTEFPSDHAERMHRVTLLDTTLVLGPQFSLDTALFRYDNNQRPQSPQLVVTTFIGKPRRLDLGFDMGMFLELVRVEQLRRAGTNALYYTFIDAQLTVDLWHSADLASYVRVRAGPSLEYDAPHRFYSLVPGVTFEGDLTLDRDGFHHLTFGVEGEKLYFDPVVEDRPLHPERLKARVGYELILLAINDQPVSLRVDAEGRAPAQ